MLPNVQVTNSFRESGSAKLCNIVTMALATYPKIIPKTSMVIESFIRADTTSISTRTVAAPEMAAIICAILPIAAMNGYTAVPLNIVSMATPSPAPALTPSTSGPASGFRKSVCISKPARESDEPAIMAVIAFGRR